MALTVSVRCRAAKAAPDAEAGISTDADISTGTGTSTGINTGTGTGINTGTGTSTGINSDADGLAVASFVLGLIGLLVMNILLGPTAIVMAVIALARSTSRRGRAFLGLALGVADLVVLAFLVTGSGTVSWNFAG
ncbi:DUF4190 domain-containing protein [Streptomyces sp. NPDC088251]|uniref:DUF4190 domain-containing protein n=1 Tax=unclassified Streptomyces TaxID=2593676 RepID=UPI00382FE74A